MQSSQRPVRNIQLEIAARKSKYKKESDQEYPSRYTRAFLDDVFGPEHKSWNVQTYSLANLKAGLVTEAIKIIEEDDRLSLAYMSDTKLTLLWLHDYPGWLEFCKPTGIFILPSPKLAKRLTIMTRTAYLHAMLGLDEIAIAPVEPGEFSDYDVEDVGEEAVKRFLDGGNVISRELVEIMMTNGVRKVEQEFMLRSGEVNPHDRTRYNMAIDKTYSMTSFRLTTPEGIIKGDSLISTREQMGGYDVLYCNQNIKKELRTTKFMYVIAEPHYGMKRHIFSPDQPAPKSVWTDDQSMSWMGDWLYDREMLKDAFQDFADSIEIDLTESRYPRFFTAVARLSDEFSTVKQFQQQALAWELEGPGRNERISDTSNIGTSLDQSIFLQERIAQGSINLLAKKRRWPVPCAIYAHVATDSWLHMAGYDSEEGHPWPFDEPRTPRGYIWFHEPTGRMIYNDLDFAEAYDRHGGWDLDDSVKYHYRTIDGRRKIVNLRSPNSWGEYDIKNYVEGTYFPVWHKADGTEVAFPEVNSDAVQPEFIEELDVEYQYPEGLSPESLGADDGPHFMSGPYYMPDMAVKATVTSICFDGIFGRRVNADIVYSHTMKTYRRHQLASIEAMVDACTQEQSDLAQKLIEQDTEAVVAEIIASGVVADRILWRQRFKRLDDRISYGSFAWTEMTTAHDDLCSMYQQRLMALAQRTPERIHPDILELGSTFTANGAKLTKWYYDLVARSPRPAGMKVTEFYHQINQTMVDYLSKLPVPMIYNLMFGIAHHVYTTPQSSGIYKDTVLFQLGADGSSSIFNWYLEAINFFGIGDETWTGAFECLGCANIVSTNDRLEYQAIVWSSRCSDCRS